MTRMIAADNSGTICNIRGIVTEKGAKDFVKNLQELYENYHDPSKISWYRDPPQVTCRHVSEFIDDRMSWAECDFPNPDGVTHDGYHHFKVERVSKGESKYDISGEYDDGGPFIDILERDVEGVVLRTCGSTGYMDDEIRILRRGSMEVKSMKIEDLYEDLFE